MYEIERVPAEQLIAGVSGSDVDPEPPAPVQQAEAQPLELVGKAGRERERVAVVAHAAEAGDRDEPAPGQRRKMQSLGGVVREIVQVDEGGLAEVVVREVEVADLGCDDRLDACRERGVADGDAFVVLEVAALLFGVEAVAAGVRARTRGRLV